MRHVGCFHQLLSFRSKYNRIKPFLHYGPDKSPDIRRRGKGEDKETEACLKGFRLSI